MIGIYIITNKINGKVYIGKSNDIERRIKEHFFRKSQRDCTIDQAIDKYGVENFEWEVVVECSIQDIDDYEIRWIDFYKGRGNCYNIDGGGQRTHGSYNGNAKLTEQDVKDIRLAYASMSSTRQIEYQKYKTKISFGTFASIWDGRTWKHVMPEVYTDHTRNFYAKEATNGSRSPLACFSNEEVLTLRRRYVEEAASVIYLDYQDRCSYGTLQAILCGRTYKDVPIYYKQKKTWSVNL